VKHVQRAQIILLSAERLPVLEIAKRVGMQRDNLDGKAATVRMVILAVAAGVMIVAARR
jgi:hypothetical protein